MANFSKSWWRGRIAENDARTMPGGKVKNLAIYSPRKCVKEFLKIPPEAQSGKKQRALKRRPFAVYETHRRASRRIGEAQS